MAEMSQSDTTTNTTTTTMMMVSKVKRSREEEEELDEWEREEKRDAKRAMICERQYEECEALSKEIIRVVDKFSKLTPRHVINKKMLPRRCDDLCQEMVKYWDNEVEMPVNDLIVKTLKEARKGGLITWPKEFDYILGWPSAEDKE
jgi:hypothetical protein